MDRKRIKPQVAKVSRKHWQLTADYTRGALTAPKGMMTDGVSRPGWLRCIFRRWGRAGGGAVIHDAIYGGRAIDAAGEVFHCDREAADKIANQIWKEDRVPGWKRKLMFQAVRKFGGPRWENNEVYK